MAGLDLDLYQVDLKTGVPTTYMRLCLGIAVHDLWKRLMASGPGFAVLSFQESGLKFSS